MRYMLLILEERGQRPSRSPEEGRALYERMSAWGQQLQARGVLHAAESLQSDAQGVRVAVREGRRLLTDGPFTEAREMIGGFFLVECATQEEAVALAAECPAAAWATVEVRRGAPCYE